MHNSENKGVLPNQMPAQESRSQKFRVIWRLSALQLDMNVPLFTTSEAEKARTLEVKEPIA